MGAHEKRLLPPEVFDALHLSSLAFGGIGGGWVRDLDAPLCAIGHALFVEHGAHAWWNLPLDAAAKSALFEADIDGGRNDEAIAAINRRRGLRDTYARVSFEDWCAELNVDVEGV